MKTPAGMCIFRSLDCAALIADAWRRCPGLGAGLGVAEAQGVAIMDREDTRPGFSKEGFGCGLGKSEAAYLFKPYLKPISGTPEIGFR